MRKTKNKKILIFLGHPYEDGICGQLARQYEARAKEKGYKTERINLGRLKFDPILHKGYREIQKLEADLLMVQRKIKWAEHIVFIYPVWWMSMPALMKGFFDRCFLPGFAFDYIGDSAIVKKRLKGRTADIILTAGASNFFYHLKDEYSKF